MTEQLDFTIRQRDSRPLDLGQCLDLDVEWSGFKAWPYRLVIRWNDKKHKWVFNVTNLNRVEFPLSEVLQGYRLR